MMEKMEENLVFRAQRREKLMKKKIDDFPDTNVSFMLVQLGKEYFHMCISMSTFSFKFEPYNAQFFLLLKYFIFHL